MAKVLNLMNPRYLGDLPVFEDVSQRAPIELDGCPGLSTCPCHPSDLRVAKVLAALSQEWMKISQVH